MDWMTEKLERQLAIDYGCTLEQVHGVSHVFRPITMSENRRCNGWRGEGISVAVYRGKLLVMAEDGLLDW